jgi:hypothetical protein
MSLPPENPPEVCSRSFWSLEKIVILSVYASLMIWHANQSDSVEPFQIIGMAILALCLGLCWFAETRIVPMLSEKIVLQRMWIPWALFVFTVAI